MTVPVRLVPPIAGDDPEPEVEPVVGQRTGGQRFASASLTDEGAVGQCDRPGQWLDRHDIVPHYQPMVLGRGRSPRGRPGCTIYEAGGTR
jgi:hypothetical protein